MAHHKRYDHCWVRVESPQPRPQTGPQFYFYNPVTKVKTWEPPPQPARQIAGWELDDLGTCVPPTKQYDARKLYRNGTIIEVPGHSAFTHLRQSYWRKKQILHSQGD